jgi:hypothetical protein
LGQTLSGSTIHYVLPDTRERLPGQLLDFPGQPLHLFLRIGPLFFEHLGPFRREFVQYTWLRLADLPKLVFGAGPGMPPVGEQMALPGSRTNPDLVASRFLLKPGRE